MPDDEPIEQLVACRPVGPHRRSEELFKNLFVYSGSTEGVCTECGTPVWIGPRSLAIVEAGIAKPTCDDCLADWLEKGDLPKV